MKLVTQTEHLSKQFGIQTAIQKIAAAGFDGYDISLFRLGEEDFELYGDDYIERAKQLRRFADGLGIECLQAHAPFPSCKDNNDEYNQWVYSLIVKSLEICSVLGAKILVVHPGKSARYYIEERDRWLQWNIDFYRSLIPYCEKYGVKIATENMFESKDGACYFSACGSPDDFCRLVEAIDSEWILACLDIGHCALSSRTYPESFIRMMGHRVACLHVHDNDTVSDQHLVPFMGKLDFEEICKALGEIGYQGHFTFEADYTFRRYPIELYDALLEMMEQTGRYLMARIEENYAH